MTASSLASPATVAYEEIEAGETTHNGFELSRPARTLAFLFKIP